MKLLFLLLSLVFSISAMNDCCLSEFEEELTNITYSDHSDGEHENEETECEECTCSTFCSYSLVTEQNQISIPSPKYVESGFQIFFPLGNEISHPFLIFHPPIA